MIGPKYRRQLIASVLALSAIWVGSPAGAESAHGDDKSGDASKASLDITSVSVDYGDGSITVSLLVPSGEAPSSDTWAKGETLAAWPVVTDKKEQFLAVFMADGQGPVGGVLDMATKKFICAAEPTFDHGTYTAVFESACIHTPVSVAVAGAMLVKDGESYKAADLAPDDKELVPVKETCSSNGQGSSSHSAAGESACQPQPHSGPRSGEGRKPPENGFAGYDG